MTDPTTPTDQPSELDAIRARLESDYPSEIPHVEAPSPTCNDIDSAIRSVLATLKLCKKNDGDFSDAVAMELSDVEDQMEGVRSANEQLRALGMESHEIAKDVLKRLNEFCADSRRLLELLDERDEPCDVCAGTGTPISGYPCICGGSGKAIDSIPHFREVIYEKDSEIERLQKLLDERGHAYDAGLIDGAAAMNDSLEILAARNESLRRELSEARELMREWRDGLPTYDLAWLESIKSRVTNFIEPNQKDTQ